jgi:hypothetical protein
LSLSNEHGTFRNPSQTLTEIQRQEELMGVPAGLRFAPVVVVALTLACGKNTTSPTSISQASQGSIALGIYQLAMVTFRSDSASAFSSRTDWMSAANVLATFLMRGRCTMEQVLLESGNCGENAAIAKNTSRSKPSTLSASLQTGDYTLVIVNGGPGTETASYRLEGAISGLSSASTSPARKTETFSFSLPQGSAATPVMGPVRAGSGPLEVRLDFSGSFTILACVGTAASCMPMGGTPQARAFLVPDEIPAGNIQASVYFNRNFTQPTGTATGTVSFSYNPLP